MKRVALILGVIAVAAAGCGESGKDAGVGQRVHGKRLVVDMPDQFPNITATCVLGRLVIESSRSGDQGGWGYVENDARECAGQTGGVPKAER